MVQHMIHKLKVSCLPKDIPEKIEINIAELDINDFVHVRDLKVPNVTILENLESAVVGVMPPTVVKEEEVAAPAEEAMQGTRSGRQGKEGRRGRRRRRSAAKGEAKAAAPKRREEREEVIYVCGSHGCRRDRRPGQPGSAVPGTRHNVGFLVVDELVQPVRARRSGQAGEST